MKITGNSSSVKFDLENGYTVNADGEMLINNNFVVFKNSMKKWNPPHENEKLTSNDIEGIIKEVKKNINEKTIQIEFE